MIQETDISRDPIVILHVDDDPKMRELLRNILGRVTEQFSVRSAKGPDAALERLDDDVECIVSDYKMPKMNGLELLDVVRDERPEIPFILLTGNGSEDVASDAVRAGLTDYFQKSDIVQQFPLLAHRIENAVEGSRAKTSYRELFKKAVDGLALNNPETGAFIDTNPAFRSLLGLDQSALLAMNITEVPTLPPQSEQETTLLDRMEQAAAHGTTVVQECCQRPGGERFWMEIQFKPIEVRGRPFVLTQARDISERKRYARTLSAVHTSITSLVGAETPRQITHSVLSTLAEVLAADRAAMFRHAPADGWLEVVDATSLPSVVSEVPLDSGRPITDAFISGETVEVEGGSVFGRDDSANGATGQTLLVPVGSVGVIAVEYADAESLGQDTRELVEILANAAAVAFERIDKEQQIHTSQAELSERKAELQRLERVNAALRDLNDTLLQAETREEVFEAVCHQLSGMEGIIFAWIGSETGGERLDRHAWAGEIPQYLDTVSLETETSREPAVVAARTNSPVRIDNTAADLQREPWRRTALTNGVESVFAIPIAVDGITYGVLSLLFAERSGITDQFERLLFAVASSVGETVHSIERRQGLQATETVELEFEIDGTEFILGTIAAEAECALDVTGIIAEPGGTCHIFASVDGADPEQVCEVAASMSAIRDATVATADDGGGAVELRLEIPLLGVHNADCAVKITELLATAEAVNARLDVARPGDVRTVATAILERYPDARLVAKRTRMNDRSDYDRLLAFQESLTPRQREVVHLAYLHGYFQSPRQCSGEELGEKLGISSQAVYQHIRSAERNLFDVAFRQVLSVTIPEE